ncbi:MAG: aminopeptidase P family protein [Bacillota bacterium]|nr:aminopeptidase P family protein [Bacillota bacterium]
MYKKRRKNLNKNLEENSMVVVFSGKAPRKSEDNFYKFHSNRNFFYLTGINRENFIYICNNTDQSEEVLFIQKPNEKTEKWFGRYLKEEEAKEISQIENIKYNEELTNYLVSILKDKDIDNVYLDIKNWEIDEPLTLSQKISKVLTEKYPHIKIKNLNKKLENLRLIKDENEIKATQKAIDITKEAIKNMMIKSKEGMYEYEIEANYNYILGINGVTTSFDTIAASGENAVILHYIDNSCKTKKDDLILCDLGVRYKEYNSDITRTFPVNGKFTDRQKEVYKVVLDANKEVIKSTKPGMTLTDLNEIAKKVLYEGCKKLGLIDKKEELSKYYYHSVSHFLGLDVHDVGGKKIKFEKDMLITVEPGLYIEEEGIGIRIEDNILITKDKAKNLSKKIVKEIKDIEDLMKK